jgi:pantothenate kinase type III
MGAKEIQKNQKNGKPIHGVMICDVVPKKNTKMENQCHVYLSGPTNWARPNKATDE